MGEHQLTQISLNFKTSCHNLKSEFREQNCVWVLYYVKFKGNYDILKSPKQFQKGFTPMYSVLNTLPEYILLHIKKHYFIHICCLFSKSLKAFSVAFSKICTNSKDRNKDSYWSCDHMSRRTTCWTHVLCRIL